MNNQNIAANEDGRPSAHRQAVKTSNVFGSGAVCGVSLVLAHSDPIGGLTGIVAAVALAFISTRVERPQKR